MCPVSTKPAPSHGRTPRKPTCFEEPGETILAEKSGQASIRALTLDHGRTHFPASVLPPCPGFAAKKAINLEVLPCVSKFINNFYSDLSSFSSLYLVEHGYNSWFIKSFKKKTSNL